jgi:hypothetical protein
LIPQAERSRIPITFVVGIAIVAVLVTGAVMYSRYATPDDSQIEKPLPMGPAEQAYAQQIYFLEPKMSRAANFLNQEVTFVFGTVENGGNRKIKQIEITVEFHDPFHQVVLRDMQRLFLPNATPMLPGQQRDFQVGYEHIPAQWDNGYPTIRVTGLTFK